MLIVTDSRCSVKEGDRYGRILVIGKVFLIPVGKRKRTHFVGQCDCGVVKVFRCNHARGGAVTSCGCVSKERTSLHFKKHGETKSRLFRIWSGMKTRCTNSNSTTYARYGGRGISVCDEWMNGFEAFRDWANANGYADNLEIDRKENDGNYEPNNCRWATRVAQTNNKRDNHIITAFGETKTAAEWSRDARCKVNAKILRQRITRYKWSPEDAIGNRSNC
jgi:hypothetical protein